uniref:Uncharacterized protein n=1 Tax=Ciona savignyi TaxID=51511 RepID=H2ZCW0_CIOSA
MELDDPAIVIDNGSNTCKVGFGGEHEPRFEIPCAVGQPPHTGVMVGMSHPRAYIGQEALERSGISYHINCPIERGIITKSDEMEKLWSHVFYEKLQTKPDHRQVLLTETPFNPKANREKMAEIMFESFNVGGLHVALEAVLSLYSGDITTGVALYSGDGLTYSVPIYEGYLIRKAIQKVEIAGLDVTDFLAQKLNKRGYTFLTTAERISIQNMKENVCFVSSDFEHDNTSDIPAETNYNLPDGRTITLHKEAFQCPEALFQPSLLGINSPGIHEILYNSISKCTLDTRRSLYSNIVLAGGSTLFPGFSERIRKEISTRAPSTINVRTIAPPERKYTVWTGGSIIAELTSFPKACLQKHEYDEVGPTAIHRKCL